MTVFYLFLLCVVPKPFGFVQNQDSDSELIQNGGDHRKPVTAKLAVQKSGELRGGPSQ